ncbi:MAG: hypothetical protein ABI662_05270 [Dermatophilaceae bacterium]
MNPLFHKATVTNLRSTIDEYAKANAEKGAAVTTRAIQEVVVSARTSAPLIGPGL